MRIDDSQHQLGATGFGSAVISGDPKTFGTVYVGKRGIMVGTSAN